jgi:carbamoyl-phosphate synthase large subunit
VARKAYQKSPNIIDMICDKQVSFVVNLSKTEEIEIMKENEIKRMVADGFQVRRATVDNQIPLFIDLHLARAFIKALSRYSIDDLEIKSYKEYLNN